MAEERVQRRLAAILAADVVGYSRLMGEDETGTLAALKAERKELREPKSAEYHGRIVKLTGDGTLMEFGSAVDAVLFAVDVQRAIVGRNAEVPEDRRITYRVGINIGDIIIDGDDIYGDGVNVAARLEGLADSGGVCVSRTVYDHIKGKVDLGFEDLGEQKVKNIREPVQVYRVKPDDTDTQSVALSTAGEALPLPDKPSIAVLPFDNMSGDPEQEYFADGIAEDVVTVDDDIANVDAHAVGNAAVFGHLHVAPHYGALNVNSEENGIDSAAKLHQRAIAGQLYDAPVILGALRLDQLFPVPFECGERSRLVLAHEAAVADHVGRQDRR